MYTRTLNIYDLAYILLRFRNKTKLGKRFLTYGMWRLPWWWQKLRLICGYTWTRLHSITFRKTAVIVTALKTPNLTRSVQIEYTFVHMYI